MPASEKLIRTRGFHIDHLGHAQFTLSRNDRKIVMFGQLLTTLRSPAEAAHFATYVDAELQAVEIAIPAAHSSTQAYLFE